ncbi:MAG: tyramine oxidase, partial [Ktedonobacteraceae bacterium]
MTDTIIPYPLDPLTAEEIAETARIIREKGNLPPNERFIYITLREPAKELLQAYTPGDEFRREAEVVLVVEGQTYEAIVDLVEHQILELLNIPGVQAAIPFEELVGCEECVKADPRFIEAMVRRGIT